MFGVGGLAAASHATKSDDFHNDYKNNTEFWSRPLRDNTSA